MSFIDKAKNKAQQLAGQGKEQAGKATGDKNLQAEGKGDQTKGNIKDAGEKIKDTFK